MQRFRLMPSSGPALLLGLFFLGSGIAHGQLRVGAKLGDSRYLKYETIPLDITLENNTGNELLFDNDVSPQAHVTVNLRPLNARVFEKRVINLGSAGAFRLAAGQRKDMQTVLNGPGMFSLQKDEDYEVYVQAGHPRLMNDFRSKTMKLEVRDGQPVWSTVIGVPNNVSDKGEAKISSRTVSVLWFSGADVDHYALQIEDSENVYGVIRIGQRISSAKPECQVDALSNIHILLRMSSRIYGYKIYNFHGRQLQLKLLAVGKKEGPPRLVRDQETGIVRHQGGQVARRGEDYEVVNGDQITDIQQ